MNEEHATITAAPSVTDAPKRKRGSRRSNPLIFILIAAVLIVAVIVIIKIVSSRDDDSSIFDAKAFFLRHSADYDSKYALFKKNGDKVTDFKFVTASEFVNGYAYVQNDEGKAGVINEDGNMTVDFGKYAAIDPMTGFYEATDESGVRTLILGNGKEIAKDYDSVIESVNMPYVFVAFKDNQYKLFDANGNTKADFKSDDMPSLSDGGNSNHVGTAYYDGKLAILDGNKLKTLYEEKSDIQYQINTVSPDRKSIVLSDSSYEHYATFAKDKFNEYGDKCSKVSLYRTNEKTGFFSCEKDDTEKLIRGGEVTDIAFAGTDDVYDVFDEDHYTKYNAEANEAEIFVSGDKKATVKATSRPSVSTNGYAIRNRDDNKISLYDTDGKEYYTLGNVTSGGVTGYDENGNVIVNDYSQESNKRYFIVNKNGDIISERYSRITEENGNYVAYDYHEGKAAWLDKDGKEVVSGEYDSFETYGKKGEIVLAKKSSTEYTIVDVKNRKTGASMNGFLSYYEAGYFQVESNNKIQFYTLEGKLIHEYSNSVETED